MKSWLLNQSNFVIIYFLSSKRPSQTCLLKKVLKKIFLWKRILRNFFSEKRILRNFPLYENLRLRPSGCELYSDLALVMIRGWDLCSKLFKSIWGFFLEPVWVNNYFCEHFRYWTISLSPLRGCMRSGRRVFSTDML